MYFWGNDFEELCEKNCRQYRVYADIYPKNKDGGYNGTPAVTYTAVRGSTSAGAISFETAAIVSVKIVKGKTSGSFEYGGAFSGQLTLVTTANANIPADGTKITISVSFVSDNGTETGKAVLGTFFAESVATTLFTKTIKATDGIARLTKYYVPNESDFPMTAKLLLEKVAAAAGIESVIYESDLKLNNPNIIEAPLKKKGVAAGEEDPEQQVYVAAGGEGTKYHSNPNCSGMNGNVITMTRAEAEAEGYTKCSKSGCMGDESSEDEYYTYREIAGMIASINAGNAFVSALNHLNISTPDIGLKRKIPIKSVISYTDSEVINKFSTTFWTQNYEGEGTPPEIDPLSEEYDPSIMVIDFPLKTDSDYTEMQNNIDGQISGISYNGIVIKKQGTGRQEIGDLLAFSDTYRNKTFDNVLVMGIVYDISAQNGFTETLYSLSQSEAKQQAQGLSLNTKIDRVEATVSKSNDETLPDDEVPPNEEQSDTEIIHFKRNGIEYGAVGIHDVGGEASIALSITQAASGLLLIDENGEKILEYVPNKRDNNKPYEIKEGLWFIPVKSKNVPSFDGIYAQCPYRTWSSGSTTKVFNNLSDMISANPEARIIPKCTLFADSDEAVNFYKKLGFERVYNIQAFENDEWEIMGLKSDKLLVTINGIAQSYGRYNGLTVWANEYDFGTTANVLRRSTVTDYYGKYYAFFWSAPALVSTIPRRTCNLGLYAAYEKEDQSETPIGFCLGGGMIATSNEYSYEALWGEYINPSPTISKKELKIYKNIIMMNDTKIYNEDGTEYFN